MSLAIFLSVLGAAALHALWNAVVKGGRDKGVAMAAVVIGQGACGAALLPFVPAPAAESWGLLALSVALHVGYQVFLLQAYKRGDLTQVYPIARGSAPILVAAVSVGFLGVELSLGETAGILAISLGLASLVLVRQSDGLRNPAAAGLALATGCFIAAYSLADGFGARQAGTAVGFYGWVSLLNAVVFAGFAAVARPRLLRGLPGAWRTVAVGGGASFAAYAIVVHAFTQAPIALVTALRETSIVFALLIGVVFLRERLDLAKLVSTMITLTGAALLRVSKG